MSEEIQNDEKNNYWQYCIQVATNPESNYQYHVREDGFSISSTQSGTQIVLNGTPANNLAEAIERAIQVSGVMVVKIFPLRADENRRYNQDFPHTLLLGKSNEEIQKLIENDIASQLFRQKYPNG